MLESPALRRIYRYVSESGCRNFVFDVLVNGEVQFSTELPIYKRKRICVSGNSSGNGNSFEDCPNDGNLYGRKYGKWAALTGAITVNLEGTESGKWYLNGESVGHDSGETVNVESGSYTIRFGEVRGMITPPDQTVNISLGDAAVVTGNYQSLMYYGYISDGMTFSVSQITASMLDSNTVTETDSGSMTCSIHAPAGSVVFALLPAESGLTANKDDGLGGKTGFNMNNGMFGTGANGISMRLNGMEYLAYGEFNLVNGETIIYIGEA